MVVPFVVKLVLPKMVELKPNLKQHTSQLNAEDYLDDKYMTWIGANETLAMWTMTLEETAPVSPGGGMEETAPVSPGGTDETAPPPGPMPGGDTPPMDVSSGNYQSFLAFSIGFVVALLNYMFI